MAGDRDLVTVPTLLKYNEEQFSTAISSMAPVILMKTISGLQQEMRSEQENFNSLGQQLDGLKDKRSQQYKQISKDLMASQTRLTLLMNRSMQCFSQQSAKSQTQTLDRRNHSNRAGKLRANSDANLLSSSLSAHTPEPRERSSSFTTQKEIQPQSNRHSVNIVSLSKHFQNGPNFGLSSPQQNNNLHLKASDKSKANNNHVNSNQVQLTTTTASDSAIISKNSTNNQNLKTGQQNQRVIIESNPVKIDSRSESFSVTKPSAKSVSNTVAISNDPPQQEKKKIVYKIPQVSALRQAFEGGKVDNKTVNVKIPNGLSHNAANGLQNGTKSKFVSPTSGTVNVVQNGTKAKVVSQTIMPREDLKTSKIDLDSSFNPRKFVKFEDPAITDRKSILKSLEANTVQLSKIEPESNEPSGNANDQSKVLLPRKSSLKKRKPDFLNINSERQPSAVVIASNSSQGPKTNSQTLNSSSNLNKQKANSAPAKAAQMSKDTLDGVKVKSVPVVKDAVPVTSIDDIVIEERCENPPVDNAAQRLKISSIESKSVDPFKETIQPKGT